MSAPSTQGALRRHARQNPYLHRRLPRGESAVKLAPLPRPGPLELPEERPARGVYVLGWGTIRIPLRELVELGLLLVVLVGAAIATLMIGGR